MTQNRLDLHVIIFETKKSSIMCFLIIVTVVCKNSNDLFINKNSCKHSLKYLKTQFCS